MNALVVGFSLSGKAACKLLAKNNFNIKVYEDNLDIDTSPYINIKNEDFYKHMQDIDIVIVSPSIAYTTYVVEYAKKCGIEVISEVELAYRFSNHDIVAITGTNGKTTTTLLIKKLLQNSGIDARDVGNIGKPYSSELLDMQQASVAVLEVSSYQLEGIVNFRSKYAICLNISEDHLLRHKSFSLYSLCKEKLFINQTEKDVAILNFDDPIVRDYGQRIMSKVFYFSLKERVKGVYVFGEDIIYENNKIEKILKISDIKMKGEHNLANALSAILFAKLLNIDNSIIKDTLSYFKPPQFRIEYVGRINNKNIYNDSKATNIDSTIKAIKSIKGSICLICGGFDKGISYDKFFKQLGENVKNIIFFGDNTYTILSFMPDENQFNYQIATSMKRAVEMAFSTKCENILFSPSTSSFDRYSSYIERGEDFNKEIKEYYRGENKE